MLKEMLAASAVLGCATIASAGAAVTVTTDPADITPTFTQDFTGVADVDFSADILLGPVDLNPVLPASASTTATSTFAGDFQIDAEALEIFLDNGNLVDLTLTFDEPILAFGGDFAAVNAIPSLTASVLGVSVDLTNEFQGIVSDTGFTELTFSISPDSGSTLDFFTLDNIVIQAVPEPATLGLLALGGLAMIRRR